MKARRPAAARDDAPHVERAYRDLKAGIVKGRYRPGASLSEVSLASEHGMSRTPIREGLARLWQEGYLERVVGHGYFVARVTVQQIHDTFDVRRLLEGAAAARAAELATPEDVDRLRQPGPRPHRRQPGLPAIGNRQRRVPPGDRGVRAKRSRAGTDRAMPGAGRSLHVARRELRSVHGERH